MKYDNRNQVDTWRWGNVQIFGRGFSPPAWVDHGEIVNIKPNERLDDIRSQIAGEHHVDASDVRILIPDF